MNRRKALKVFGALFVCLAGRFIVKAQDISEKVDTTLFTDYSNKPMDYTFSEKGMGDIIIECKDGTRLVFPFSDIVDALREEPTLPTQTLP